MSVVACRHLLDRLGRDGTVILVAHDFDRAGLAIAHTIANDGRRYVFEHTPKMIDIGLRLRRRGDGSSSEPAPDAGPTDERLENTAPPTRRSRSFSAPSAASSSTP